VRGLNGKTAVVTGAARGIGKSIARKLAQHGAEVAIVDVHPQAEKTLKEFEGLGIAARLYRANVARQAEVAETVRRIVKECAAPPTILVNNAGIIRRGTIFDLTYEDWQAVLDVNLTGTFICCKELIPVMVQAGGGQIVNVSSVAGKIGDISAAPAYGASKGGVNALTKSLARQLAEHNILVNAVAPHAIETEMSAEWDEEKRTAIRNSIPLKRLGRAEEVAETVLFLVSSGAAFITGEIVDVNGGFLMD